MPRLVDRQRVQALGWLLVGVVVLAVQGPRRVDLSLHTNRAEV
nr:hypothetical protein [Saccharopolyspora spinosa]